MNTVSVQPFNEAAIAAFPARQRREAEHAVSELAPFVDDSYRQPPEQMEVEGARIRIPIRLHFNEPACRSVDEFSLAARCLLTRSTDGYLRQASLRTLVYTVKPWAIPFAVLLIGDYVVEIVREIEVALPGLDRPAYVNFIRENRSMMRLLRSRAMSYWDAYYRGDYPTRRTYPGLVVLNEIESWAA